MLVCSSVGSLPLARILSVWWIGWPDNKILIKLGNRIWKLSACPISEGKYLEASLQLQLFCGWLSFLLRKNINYRHCQINTKRQPCSFQIIYNIYSYLCFLLFFSNQQFVWMCFSFLLYFKTKNTMIVFNFWIRIFESHRWETWLSEWEFKRNRKSTSSNNREKKSKTMTAIWTNSTDFINIMKRLGLSWSCANSYNMMILWEVRMQIAWT